MKLGVFIGRFQPFHRGHLKVVETALADVDELLILVGSAGEPRTLKNPWTAGERAEMIELAIDAELGEFGRFSVESLHDYATDAGWAHAVRNAVMAWMVRGDRDAEVVLVGHAKDHTSYYLRMFPDWRSIDVPNHADLSATQVREGFFFSQSAIDPDEVSLNTASWMQSWALSNPDVYAYMRDELSAQDAYTAAWSEAPYPPTFITADALVERCGHVALIRRGRAPFKGLLGMPGGFLQNNATLLQTAIAELTEETGDAFSAEFLRAHLRTVRPVDARGRDPRGRFVTHVHHFVLPDGDLPPLVGADDADWAGWVRLAEIERWKMAFDHYRIITSMTQEV